MFDGKSVPKKQNWNLIDKIFNKISLPYPLVSFITFILIYVIYILLSTKVEEFVWSIHQHIIVSATCALVAYLLSGIRYFLIYTRNVFSNLETCPENEKCVEDLYTQLERRFTQSKKYYVILVLVVVPFIIIPPINGEYSFFYLWEPTIWSLLLDIFNYVISLMILYFISIILWIIYNISWALDKIGTDSYKQIIKIDLFNIDNSSNLISIKNLILSLIVFLFVGISLGIITFVTPIGVFYEESILLTFLFFIGIYFFIKGWHTFNTILKYKKAFEVDIINKLYQKQHGKLQAIINNCKLDTEENQINSLLNSMEFLQNERKAVIKASKSAYDFKTIATFISSSLLPIISSYILPLIISEDSNKYELITQAIAVLEQMSKFF